MSMELPHPLWIAYLWTSLYEREINVYFSTIVSSFYYMHPNAILKMIERIYTEYEKLNNYAIF